MRIWLLRRRFSWSLFSRVTNGPYCASVSCSAFCACTTRVGVEHRGELRRPYLFAVAPTGGAGRLLGVVAASAPRTVAASAMADGNPGTGGPSAVMTADSEAPARRSCSWSSRASSTLSASVNCMRQPLGRSGARRHAFVVHLVVVQILGQRPHQRPGLVRVEIRMSSPASASAMRRPRRSATAAAGRGRPVVSPGFRAARRTARDHHAQAAAAPPRRGAARRAPAIRGCAASFATRVADPRRELRPEKRRRFGHVGLLDALCAHGEVGRLRRAGGAAVDVLTPDRRKRAVEQVDELGLGEMLAVAGHRSPSRSSFFRLASA